MPTHLDLFTGIGGFTIAAEAAGFTTIGFSEVDPYACQLLKERWPHVPNYGDVRGIPSGLGPDLITGGFPCQPFSKAGKRRGAADDRNLWPAMRDVIAAQRPSWVLGENVVGIVSLAIEQVFSDLEAIGYQVGAVVIPACAVDAPHRRDRVWIVAHTTRELLQRDGTPGPRRKPELADCSPFLAHAGAIGHAPQGDQELARAASGSREADQPRSRGEVLANAVPERLQGEPQARAAKKPAHGSTEGGDPCWWPVEPPVGRVVDGLPNRSHRLRGLGNAIVPQVAFEILREIRKLIK